ncbi:hypothetical protein PR048_011701 [Dryococelus australis]|uniref:Uncharacterized protein n=1 Tax=Dryococelus australis TaxID=614101 RepID=A0ABQ9HNL1_9NEOP|nr:hypothetical protein PR048_011701 [Dryococelus australis]
MAKAMAVVRKKMLGYLKESKEFQVPRSSLSCLAISKESNVKNAASSKLGRKPLFAPVMEHELVKYFVEMEAMVFGLTCKYVCALEFQPAVRTNTTHPFWKDNKPGKDRFYGFMKSNNGKLSIRKLTCTSFSLAREFNREDLCAFSDLRGKNSLGRTSIHRACLQRGRSLFVGRAKVNSSCDSSLLREGEIVTHFLCPYTVTIQDKVRD